MSFFSWYFGVAGDRDEEHVLCPFPHTKAGIEYFESNPSAQVNASKGVFHCKTCGRGFNEAKFMSEIMGCSTANAYRLMPIFRTNEDVTAWENEEGLQRENIPLANSFNISKETQKQLKLVSTNGVDLRVPVFMYGCLLDIRTYRPDSIPKVKSRLGAVNGLLIPFDEWVDTPANRWTILCAGEKDMAVTRSQGLNAVTLTGGENTLPLLPKYFKDRLVAICYDNDDAGRKGARKLASFLHRYGAQVKIVNQFHQGMEISEDLTDYFNKYSKTKQDLVQCIKESEFFEPSEDDILSIPLINLHQASLPKFTGRLVRGNIQVVAVTDMVFTMPSEIVATKVRVSENPEGNKMALGEVRTWALDEDTMEDVLHLVDGGFKEKQLNENQKKITKVPFKERNVAYKTYGRHTIYKAVVTDLYETASDADHAPMEYLVYSIDHRIESGKKYTGTFKVIPHPYEGQKLVMILWDVKQASDSVSSFATTPEVKNALSVFQSLGSVEDTINTCVSKMKGLLGYDGNNLLIETMDLAYHTPLTFNLGAFKNIRGYLDTLIVGESRMGKSSTAETLRTTYGLGTFVSLAGNSATVPGLIGGSNKIGGGYQTKAGLIPQNHKGLMIFEEFGKCKSDIISELTDIRSSNEVRIARVSGALTLPATVRMISLSNVKTLHSKEIRSIASYPHGVAVVTELVGSAEDIARYDVMLVLGDKGKSISDPYWEPEEPFTLEQYRARVRWIWSRKPEQIVIPQDMGHYLSQQANCLNEKFDTHIKIFGTEAWKKLARLAIAVAGYCVSSDDDYENIVVKKEHIDYAVAYMRKIYDNKTFRLGQYVQHERLYSTTDEAAVEMLQGIYAVNAGVVHHLELEHKTSKGMLGAASGLGSDQLNQVVNRLIQGMFVKLSGNDIIPTERFRLTVSKIDRRTIIKRIGEANGSAPSSY